MCSSASKSALPRASKKRRAKAMFSFADDIKECPPPCKPAFSPTGRHHEHDATQRALVHRPQAIHPSAWKRNSANFACTEFSEVRLRVDLLLDHRLSRLWGGYGVRMP